MKKNFFPSMGELRWGERVITTPVKTNTPSSILPRHEGEVDVLRALLRLACQVEHNFSLNTNRELTCWFESEVKTEIWKPLLRRVPVPSGVRRAMSITRPRLG